MKDETHIPTRWEKFWCRISGHRYTWIITECRNCTRCGELNPHYIDFDKWRKCELEDRAERMKDIDFVIPKAISKAKNDIYKHAGFGIHLSLGIALHGGFCELGVSKMYYDLKTKMEEAMPDIDFSKRDNQYCINVLREYELLNTK
jgi:hypothetical protein